MDDLTKLEKINLLLEGFLSHSYKTAVRSDIPVLNQFIPAEHLKTKEYLDFLGEKHIKEKLLRKVADSQNWLRIKGKYTIQYNKSFLEQSCVVWHSFLTEENELDLERVQKAAIRLTLCNIMYEEWKSKNE